MIRFFAAPSQISAGRTIRLCAEDAAHIRSLRLRPSELFIVCDGDGSDHICRLGGHGGDLVAEIIETRPSRGEPTVACDVYIAFAKGERLEYAVQKSIELGARSVILFQSERCVAVPGGMPKRIARLQKIADETAKQCGRGRIPEVTLKRTFIEAIEEASKAGLPLYFYECEEFLHLKQALEQRGLRNTEPGTLMEPAGNGTALQSVSIVTGPEGGFEPFEAEYARSAGMLSVSLGSRILRCETAPVAALAAIMFYTGNL